jgi:hypothetical protein
MYCAMKEELPTPIVNRLSRRALRNAAIGIGLCVVALFIISQEVRGAGELDSISKMLEWTGMVFLPLFGLNLDLYPERAAKIAGLGMLGAHAVLMTLVYRSLPSLTYITVTPLAVVEMFILVIPFLRIRRRLDPRSGPGRFGGPSL